MIKKKYYIMLILSIFFISINAIYGANNFSQNLSEDINMNQSSSTTNQTPEQPSNLFLYFIALAILVLYKIFHKKEDKKDIL